MKWKSWGRVTIECRGYIIVRATITTNDKIRQMGVSMERLGMGGYYHEKLEYQRAKIYGTE